MNEEISELRMEIHNKYCELMEAEKRTNETLDGILNLIRLMRGEMKSLRTDVDKLIENNNGGKCYGRTA